MSPLEIVVALLRGAHMAALVSLFGTLVFLLLVAPAAVAEAAEDAWRLRLRLLRVARISAALALIVGIAWLAMESAVIAGAGSIAMTLQALPVVALRTQFGQWLLVRGVLLLAVAVLPLLRPWRAGNAVATVLAAIALAVQPMLGHAGALGGSLGTTLIISEILHLLAAGAWLGGLLPLFITLGTLPHNAAATACRSFTPVGLSAVLVLGGTATVQVTEFMGGVPGLFGTAYGRIALVKLGLFAVLLTLAAINRLALTERLAGAAPDAARRHMRISVATEAVLGSLVVLTAAFLASHAPGTHEQPVWPFAWRPSLSAFYVPELCNELILALLAAGAAVIMAVTGVVWRKVRWPALVVAAITLALAIPHLDLLFVEAYPTSFYTSPTEFAATAIAIEPDALSDADHRRVREILTFATNMEYAGDIVARNLLGIVTKRLKRGVSFSEAGQTELLTMIDRLLANLRVAASLFMTGDERAARLLAGEKEVFRNMETETTDAHFERLRAGRLDTAETSALHLDALRDLKNVNTHLVAAAAYPVLENSGELLRSRLRQEGEDEAQA